MKKLIISAITLILFSIASASYSKSVRNYTVRHVVDGKVYVHHYHYVQNGPKFRMEHKRVGRPGHYEYHWHYWHRD